MNKNDFQAVLENNYLLYKGIIKNNLEFVQAKNDFLVYDFENEHFIKLRDAYDLKRFKADSEFATSLKIMHFFAPHLKHDSDYDNCINCNSLDLLEYAYKKPNGINCLNKSKIIVECLLALNIYARRVYLMPYSPYDFDNHVVLEVFDSIYNKWIMIDPTINGYFIDYNKNPLSCLEIRKLLANNEFTTAITYHQKAQDIFKLSKKNLEINCYFAKNFCYFLVDNISSFGDIGQRFCILPKNFDLQQKEITNLEYRIKTKAKKNLSKIDLGKLKNQIRTLKNKCDYQIVSYEILEKKPY